MKGVTLFEEIAKYVESFVIDDSFFIQVIAATERSTAKGIL